MYYEHTNYGSNIPVRCPEYYICFFIISITYVSGELGETYGRMRCAQSSRIGQLNVLMDVFCPVTTSQHHTHTLYYLKVYYSQYESAPVYNFAYRMHSKVSVPIFFRCVPRVAQFSIYLRWTTSMWRPRYATVLTLATAVGGGAVFVLAWQQPSLASAATPPRALTLPTMAGTANNVGRRTRVLRSPA